MGRQPDQRWYKPSAIEKQRAVVREIVDRLIDNLLKSGEHDVVRSIARPLPVLVMGAVLSLDGPDVETVSMWMDSLFNLFGPTPRPNIKIADGHARPDPMSSVRPMFLRRRGPMIGSTDQDPRRPP